MDVFRKLAALLLAMFLVLGLAGCAMGEEDAALLNELLTEAAESAQVSAPEEAPGDELVLIEETSAPMPEQTPVPTSEPTPESTPAPTAEPAPEPTAEPTPEPAAEPTPEPAEEAPAIDRDGSYTSREDVALYLHTYGELPRNFITKKEARSLGWSGGGLEDYAPGKCIGGDYFGNYEGILPPGNYHECDIDTLGARSRGAKRIIYSDDGRIYYTGDHYESFTLLYGEE